MSDATSSQNAERSPWLLYDNPLSGNCWKARQILALTDTPFRSEEVSVLGDREKDRARTAVGQRGNGRIPLLVHPDGTELRESGAILMWFAEGTDWLPAERHARQRVMEWLFFEQSLHMPYLATARYIRHVLRSPDKPAGVLQFLDDRQRIALGRMEKHLGAGGHMTTGWLADTRPTIADIALYPYTRMAPMGGIEMDGFPAVSGWLEQMERIDGFVPLPCL